MNKVRRKQLEEIQTELEAQAYDKWFKAQVQEALDDTSPTIPHDVVMNEMQALIDVKRHQKAKD